MKHFYLVLAAVLSTWESASAVASSPIEVAPTCLVTDGTLLVHAMLMIDFTYDKDTAKILGVKRSKSREIWQVECKIRTRECRAVKVSLGKLDQGGQLSIMDITLPSGMTLASSSRNVFTIVWGPWRHLTVDLKTRRISYSESGPTTEGRGSGACDDPDAK